MILRHYKAPRHDPRRDSGYLKWIRRQPCVVCSTWKLPTTRRSGSVEAAHVGERGLGQKCPDTETLPLCVLHHRTGPAAVHVLGRKFWMHWKLDRFELIEKHKESFDRRHDATADTAA